MWDVPKTYLALLIGRKSIKFKISCSVVLNVCNSISEDTMILSFSISNMVEKPLNFFFNFNLFLNIHAELNSWNELDWLIINKWQDMLELLLAPGLVASSINSCLEYPLKIQQHYDLNIQNISLFVFHLLHRRRSHLWRLRGK